MTPEFGSGAWVRSHMPLHELSREIHLGAVVPPIPRHAVEHPQNGEFLRFGGELARQGQRALQPGHNVIRWSAVEVLRKRDTAFERKFVSCAGGAGSFWTRCWSAGSRYCRCSMSRDPSIQNGSALEISSTPAVGSLPSVSAQSRQARVLSKLRTTQATHLSPASSRLLEASRVLLRDVLREGPERRGQTPLPRPVSVGNTRERSQAGDSARSRQSHQPWR